MPTASLSPTSVLASPIQVNPQVRSDLQTSTPQVAQDAQKVEKKIQTDTVTISVQALKMADDKDAAAKLVEKESSDQAALQLARDKRSDTQRKAVKAYTTVSASQ